MPYFFTVFFFSEIKNEDVRSARYIYNGHYSSLVHLLLHSLDFESCDYYISEELNERNLMNLMELKAATSSVNAILV